jgi:hypothetical protein
MLIVGLKIDKFGVIEDHGIHYFMPPFSTAHILVANFPIVALWATKISPFSTAKNKNDKYFQIIITRPKQLQ